jgi:flagellar protein FliO/FliZ
MFQNLFGTDVPVAAWFLIGLVIVVGLICATVWLARRFGAQRRGGTPTRGRQAHLAVIATAAIDGRRRLILIRRDNTEHLMMVGGPTDVVIESNIVPAARVREAQAPHPPAAGDTLPRGEPSTEEPEAEPARPEAVPRRSAQPLRAEPPIRPEQAPAPPASVAADPEPRVADPFDRLAERLAQTPHSETHATQSRLRPRQMPPLPARQWEARTPRSQPTAPPPRLPASAHPSAPERAPLSSTGRSSAFTPSSLDD